MTCQELLDLMLDFVGGELVVDQHRTVEIHLTGCERCVLLVESYKHTVRLARLLPKCGLPAAFEARLRAVLAPHFNSESEEKK